MLLLLLKISNVFAMTNNLSDVRFQDESPKDVRNKIRSANESIISIAEKQNQTVIVAPISMQVGLLIG